MVGLVRLYVYKQGVSNVFDYPQDEAKRAYKQLLEDGWTVFLSVLV